MHSSPSGNQLERVADGARRRTSASAVMRTVLEDGPVARSSIARRTGLSPASVTGHCAQLARLGLLREAPEALRTNGVGRPHIPVDLDDSRFLAGGVHVAVPYTTVALLGLRGQVVAQRRLTHRDGATEPGRILARAAEGLGALRAAQDPRATLLGVGLATGGWVDRAQGTVVEHPMLGWRDVAASELLGGLTGLPVHVDAHSRALANGERLFGITRGDRSSLHLFIGNVVDAAFATGDGVHHGPRSQAGAIAHLPVERGTVACPCGRTGCLQAEVSEQTLCRRAYEAGIVPAPSDPLLVLAAAEAGDRRAVRLLLERARLVGRAAALLLDVLNPDTVVITELGVIHRQDCLAALREEVAARTSAVVDVERTVVPTSFPAAEILAVAGGSVVLDVLYRDPLGVLESVTDDSR
ncbi:ROK family protein [Streptomyces sp. NBC_01262]|uniref:ROK family protein n=1 Tax=Streptomyces sp. NBC_01262 TaxID=2903803 RepID=UPI002E36A36B|nr:ROK family protein [Streptomyces sp. NBC_01262]